MHRVEKIKAGTDTPVEEPVVEDQPKDQDDEVLDAESSVMETKLDTEDNEVIKVTYSFQTVVH